MATGAVPPCSRPSLTATSPRTLGQMVILILLILAWSACAKTHVIPKELRGQVETVDFQELYADPLRYQGRHVALGGVVLAGRWRKDGTQLEILQLPLDRSMKPSPTLSQSQGRFFANHKRFVDPATLPPGTHVTVIGEVTGSLIGRIDEVEYAYPRLEVRSLTSWPDVPARQVPMSPYFGSYWSWHWGPYWSPIFVR